MAKVKKAAKITSGLIAVAGIAAVPFTGGASLLATGAGLTVGTLTISGTMKLDLNNTANMTLLSKIHSFITNGEISQFRDVVQFELLSGVSNSTMTYTKYQAPVVIKLSDLGGNAEDEAEFSYEISLQGKGTVVTSS